MRLTRLLAIITTLAVLVAACGLARQENTSSGTAQPTATAGATSTAGQAAATATPPVEPTAASAQPTATPAEPSAAAAEPTSPPTPPADIHLGRQPRSVYTSHRAGTVPAFLLRC